MTERKVGAADVEPVANAVKRNVNLRDFEKHWFIGISNGDCEVCSLPDTNPVHHLDDVKI